jgi:hypothetical protein
VPNGSGPLGIRRRPLGLKLLGEILSVQRQLSNEQLRDRRQVDKRATQAKMRIGLSGGERASSRLAPLPI